MDMLPWLTMLGVTWEEEKAKECCHKASLFVSLSLHPNFLPNYTHLLYSSPDNPGGRKNASAMCKFPLSLWSLFFWIPGANGLAHTSFVMGLCSSAVAVTCSVRSPFPPLNLLMRSIFSFSFTHFQHSPSLCSLIL